MEKIKKLIIIISIIICILLIFLILIKNSENNKPREDELGEEISLEEEKLIFDIKKEEKVYSYIFANDILNKMFYYISEEEKNVNNSEALIYLLDNEYKQKNGITEENILKFLADYKDVQSYFTKEIYTKEVYTEKIAELQDFGGCYVYIKGIIRKNLAEEYIYILMKQDYINSTYNISIITEQEFNAKGNDNREIVIEKNDYNSTYSMEVTDYRICYEYFTDYINCVKNNPEKAYELLEKEYKEKRFGDINNYINYINNIKDKLFTSVLKSYSIERENDSIEYVCVDQRGNYYIFKKKEMMNYSLILDTYTIDLSQFIEKYNKANSIEKCKYNIQKCIEAINNKDYNYVYNKLDNEFKANNYKIEKDFENIIKQKLFDTNKVESSSVSNEGDIYIYKLIIVDTENETSKQNMTVIMQLKEGTEFVMSFSFE